MNSSRDPIGITCKPLPTTAVLNECFHLSDGMLVWKYRPVSHFRGEGYWRKWNSAFAGRRADIDMGAGYRSVCIFGTRYKAHRVVYALTHDVDPGAIGIDHINGVPGDNRPENLRLATPSQNAVNFRGPRADNTHGGRGVKWNARSKKWVAWAMKSGKKIALGYYKSHDEAVLVAANARKELFGEFYA